MNNTNKKELVIALAGNPNSGKTTIFNALTGLHQHVGNWPGVTVERKEGIAKYKDYTLKIVDLPGIYSLSTYSHEEIIARDFLLDEDVDAIINVVDASNIERNLYLTTQLLELNIPTIIALNMVDMLEKSGKRLDIDNFSNLLGVPAVATVANRADGMNELLEKICETANNVKIDTPRSAKHSPEIEHELVNLYEKLNIDNTPNIPLRWLLLKTLEGDIEAQNRLLKLTNDKNDAIRIIDSTKQHIREVIDGDLEAVIADGRYGFICGLLREVLIRTNIKNRLDITQKIDNILLNRILGIPIFLTMMWVTFLLTFNLGGYFAEYIETGIGFLSNFVFNHMPEGLLTDLIVQGIIPGVGGVLVFLPNILILFLIISFLEDSGYMARAAFIMDKSMHKFGLHGKSFIPMLIGFGCSIPGVMAARTLDTDEDRLITIFITPLMSCAARLPIYVLFTSIFFSEKGAFVIFSIYMIGVLLAVISGKLFRKFLFPKAVSPFVMELPPYRLPTLKGTAIHIWEKSVGFLMKAGTIILAASVIMWVLATLPYGVEYASQDSLAGKLGMIMEPIVKPLGMHWRDSVALLFGLGAKEIVVGTLGVLYGGVQGIEAAFTPLTAYTFMLVSLIYVPCFATVATIRKETNSFKWTAFSVCYTLILAYLIGLGVYQIGKIFGL